MHDTPDSQPQFQPWALTITGPNSQIFDLAEALGFDAVMDALSISVFEENDAPAGDSVKSTVEALYPSEADAKTALAGLSIACAVRTAIKQLPTTDWVSLSQEGLPPVAAGRFWVYGSHDSENIPVDVPHTILIDAGLAFGTGHHGTTTIDVTTENAHLNGVGARIKAAQADGFHSPVFEGRTFELIFANILAGPLMGLAPDIAAALAPNGRVILSGIIDDMAARVSETFTAQGLSVSPQPSIDGWTSLLAIKT